MHGTSTALTPLRGQLHGRTPLGLQHLLMPQSNTLIPTFFAFLDPFSCLTWLSNAAADTFTCSAHTAGILKRGLLTQEPPIAVLYRSRSCSSSVTSVIVKLCNMKLTASSLDSGMLKTGFSWPGATARAAVKLDPLCRDNDEGQANAAQHRLGGMRHSLSALC
jgi:hypothetical protein